MNTILFPDLGLLSNEYTYESLSLKKFDISLTYKWR